MPEYFVSMKEVRKTDRHTRCNDTHNAVNFVVDFAKERKVDKGVGGKAVCFVINGVNVVFIAPLLLLVISF